METLVISGFLALVFVAVFSVPIHELGHFLSAKAFGVNGDLHLYWSAFSGSFSYPEYLTDKQMLFIAFGGGGFQALLILILWAFQPLRRIWYVSVFYAVVFGGFLIVGLMESLALP